MCEKDLYMPIFYNSLELTESLSDAEFGQLVRMLLKKLGGREEPKVNALPPAPRMAYNFMLESAERIVGRRGSESHQKKLAEAKRHGNFDPKEAFERALERTYGKK